MALIHADVAPHALLEQDDLEPGSYPDAALVLSAPGMPDLSVPLLPANPEAPTTDVSVWDWKGKGRDEGEEAASWLSKFIGQDVRLVRYAGARGVGGGAGGRVPGCCDRREGGASMAHPADRDCLGPAAPESACKGGSRAMEGGGRRGIPPPGDGGGGEERDAPSGPCPLPPPQLPATETTCPGSHHEGRCIPG